MSSHTCPHCQQAVAEDWLTCSHCGRVNPTRKSKTTRCQVCNHRVLDMLQVCPYCGSTIQAKKFPAVQLFIALLVVLGLVWGTLQLINTVPASAKLVVLLVSTPTPTSTNTATSTHTPTKYKGLILTVDGLEPESGQPQLWVARELLSDTVLAAGWLPRV
ncbi:zinc ribbon domain-containing protein, partial [Anaerolineales bacterium HSG24]|nr:zinc ribbon domain-containing protein [Anaerolineales bacterium HSG24]